MAYQALYRKYRPLTFSDVIGQEHITTILKKELCEGKTVHAYLFTGSRGTGKTSCAKILAKAINCLEPVQGDPCLKCRSCLAAANDENTDIVEIDAASNNGVDDIRGLRDMIGFAPAQSKYRVYIIDEVHMLSIGAFNALLKTLEEPPEYVVFILATTEVHKLPATILSRCQRFDFKRIESEKIRDRIKYIAEKEGLAINDEAAMLIAAAADGGMRDALSILDVCASAGGKIDTRTVENACAMAGSEYLSELAGCIKDRDTEKALTLIDELHNSSVDMLRLLNEMTLYFRDLMVIKTVKSGKRPVVCSKKRLEALEKQASEFDLKEILFCIDQLQNGFAAMQTGNRRCEMELLLVKLCTPAVISGSDSLERRVSDLEKRMTSLSRSGIKPSSAAPFGKEQPEIPDNGTIIPSANSVSAGEGTFAEGQNPQGGDPYVPEDSSDTVITDTHEPAVIREDFGGAVPVAKWAEIIAVIRQECPLLVGVLNDSSAYIKDDYLLIDAKNEQFRSLINSGNPIYKNSIRKAASQILGVTYKLGPYTKQTADEKEDPLKAFAQKLKSFEIN